MVNVKHLAPVLAQCMDSIFESFFMTSLRCSLISHNTYLLVLKLRGSVETRKRLLKKTHQIKARSGEEQGQEAHQKEGWLQSKGVRFPGNFLISDFSCAWISPSPLGLSKGHLQMPFPLFFVYP